MIYAVKYKGAWSIAQKIKAAEYGPIPGDPPDADVWGEVGTTAYICLVGHETVGVLLDTQNARTE